MLKYYQQGFAPIIIVILLTIIGASSFLIIKNIPFNQPKSDQKQESQASNSAQIKASPSATISQAKSKSSSSTPTKKTTPTPTNAPSSSNNSNNPTSTPTPGTSNSPTSTPTPTQISSATNTPTPTTRDNYSVRITSPNGGETLKIGDTVHITWEATGTFSTFILSGTEFYNGGEGGFNIGSVDPSARSMDWVVNIGNAVTPRQAKINITANRWPRYVGDEAAAQKNDSSDNYFTITR